MLQGHGEGIRRQRNEEVQTPLKSYFPLLGCALGLLWLARIWKTAPQLLQWDGTVEEGTGEAEHAEKCECGRIVA